MELLENINEIGNNLNNNLNLENLQNIFLNTTVGKITNAAVDLGIKALMPDFVENEVIEVKDALISGGLKEGLDTAVKNAIDVGKKAIGLENVEFSSIEDAATALYEGDIVGGISNGLDFVLDNIANSEIIPENITYLIKQGKDIILNDVDSGIKNEFTNEIKALNKLEKYISNWEKNYLKKDMEGVQKEYKKIEKQMIKILPLEKIINNVNKIRNIHDLIESTRDFDFDKIYLELADNINKIA